MAVRPKKGEEKKGFDASMTDRQAREIIENAWKNYAGDCTVLMSAAGALMIGRAIGWQGVRVCMSATTYRKYERALGVRFRDVLPDRLHDSYALNGIIMVDKFSNFWASLSKGKVSALQGRMVM